VQRRRLKHPTFFAPRFERRPLSRVREDVMTQPTEKEIKNRAYEIGERNGRPEGKEDEFWQLAEQELRNEDKSSPVRTPDNL
jgi:hypothetical protein